MAAISEREDRPGPQAEHRLRESVDPREQSAESLRSLRHLLLELDPQEKWGGLIKTLTPEEHWLWLCEEHRLPYIR